MKIHLANSSERAATLVEALVATCIIALTGVGVIGSINYGMFVMGQARENQRATQILLECVEAVRLCNWQQVNDTDFFPPFPEPYDPQTPGKGGVNYYVSVSRSQPVFSGYTPTYASSMRQFTITINWTNSARLRHSRSFTTYVAKDGMQNYVY